ncbi:MAG: hypothetical protein ACI92G_001591 [Candidatus Pelagisphaera sp.]|jgi:hypothetical protein
MTRDFLKLIISENPSVGSTVITVKYSVLSCTIVHVFVLEYERNA